MLLFNNKDQSYSENIQNEMGMKWNQVHSLISQSDEWAERVNHASDSKTPPVDIFEDDQYFMVNVELPGFSSEDIVVEVAQNQISFHAEKKRLQNDTNGKIRLYERGFGVYRRQITFPVEVNPTKAQAKYHDGVLIVNLPKKNITQIRPVDIEFLNEEYEIN